MKIILSKVDIINLTDWLEEYRQNNFENSFNNEVEELLIKLGKYREKAFR